jgi:peptidoglycan hydrolase-like protein with peptidoglycan-binding domain
MSKLKTIVFGFMALALVVTPVLADEEADIQSEMDALEEMLADLAAELGTTTEDTEEEATETVSVEGIPADFAFSTPMGQGAEGVAVQYLQILLNADPATQVAASGVGSAGNETTYYGPATAAAVVKFQNKYASEVLTPLGLTAGTGYFGNSSIAKANALLGGEAPVDPTDPVEDDDIMEMLQEIAEAVAALQTRVDDLESGVTEGTEGTVETTTSPDVYSVTVKANQHKAVAKFDVEAKDSDLTVQRVNVSFDHATNMSKTNLRNIIDTVYLYYNGEEVGAVELTRDSLTEIDGTEYYVSFTGLNIEVAEDTTEAITVKVDAKNFVEEDGDDLVGEDITVSIPGEGLRALDTAGINQYNSTAANRDFAVSSGDLATITTSVSDDTPEEGVVEVVADELTEDVTLAIFNVKAEDGDAEMTDVSVTITSTDKNVDDVVARLRLYVDGVFVEELTSELDGDMSSAESFEVDYIAMEEDDEMEIEVVADIYGTDNFSDAEGVTLTATLTEVAALDADENSVSDGTDRTGETQSLYTAVPTLELTDSGIERTDDRDVADAYLTFEVTAVGGDIYIDDTTTVALVFATYAGVSDTTWTVDTTVGGDYTDGGTYYLIEEDETMTFDVVGDLGTTGNDSDSTFVRLQLENFVWGHADDDFTSQTWNQADWQSVDDIETDRLSVYLSNPVE